MEFEREERRGLRQLTLTLGKVQQISQIGVWTVSVPAMTMTWSEEMFKILGLVPGDIPPGIDAFLAFVTMEQRTQARAWFDDIAAGRQLGSVEFSLTLRNGAQRHVQGNGELVEQDEGERFALGTLQDITERKLAGQSLRESEARFRAVARATADAIWDWDLKTDTIWWSEGMESLFGFPRGEPEPCSESWQNRIHPDDRARVLGSIGHAVAHSEHWRDEYRFARKDGGYAFVLDRGMVIRNARGDAVRMVGGMTDMTQKRVILESLREHEERYALVIQASQTALWEYHIPQDAMRFPGDRFYDMLGYQPRDFSADAATLLAMAHPDDRARIRETVRRHFLAHRTTPARFEFRLKLKSGAYRWFASTAQGVTDAQGRPFRLVGSVADITERKEATLALTRSNRALQMLSRSNHAVMRAARESELLNEICRLALEIGGYRMAWVGYARDDEDKSIEVVGLAGAERDAAHVRAKSFSWDPDSPFGQGPAGRTIREGRASSIRDVSALPENSPQRAAARRARIRGVLALPLRDADRTFGVMFLYCRRPLDEAAEELSLLQDLADNLAFGITGLRVREGQRRIHAAIENVASSVSVSSSGRFLDQLANNMMEAVGAGAGFILRAHHGEKATAIACVGASALAEKARVDIAGTPFGALADQDFLLMPDQLQTRFPGCSRLAAFPARAFAGHRLTDARGATAGMLFVLFAHPVRDPGFIESALRIFATRAAAELKKRDADSQIRDQASLLDKAQDAIIVRSLANRIEYWNKSAERLYGWRADEMVGRQVLADMYADSETFLAASQVVLRIGEWTGETTHFRRDGTVVAVESRWTLLRNEDGTPRSILSINTDITQRRQAEQKIKQLAFYDSLTQLPNRLLLLDRLEIAKVKSGRTASYGALLFVDLDNFKTLNDTLGHDKGDRLLQLVAARLTASVRVEDTVARLGGDEFVIMLESLGRGRDEAIAAARSVGEKILAAFLPPFQLSGYEHYSTPSIGVTLFQGQKEQTDDILKRADLAMYQAKANGRNTACFFDPAMQTLLSDRASLEADIRQGLAQQEFVLFYQPQIDEAGRVTGAEALVRWRHPQRGLVPTGEFIAVCEEAGLILALGQWVLEAACRQLRQWAGDPATSGLTLAINISTRQLRHPDFVEQVQATIARHGIDAARLKLELTESVLVDNPENAAAKMSTLKARGIDFALDDFGTGYSSLSYLKRLPLDQLKIDRSFVRDITTDSNDAAIVCSIIALGQSLGLDVIAEGVETAAQHAFLKMQGCLSYQGFFFSEPLPAEAFRHYLRTRNGVAA